MQHFYLPLGRAGCEADGVDDWLSKAPSSHHDYVRDLPSSERQREHARSGMHLMRQGSFRSACRQNQLSLTVSLETPATAQRLKAQVETLACEITGMESLLLEQFIEKDYGDDLLLLTATEETSGRLLGLIFWRYLHGVSDEYWEHLKLDWEDIVGADANSAIVGGAPISDAFVLIELVCTDRSFRGRGIGKLLLVGALAYCGSSS
eukprot:TRINITY_DN26714_c0_g1_i1.p1 TRINITY_DN26714_c0_g1~~TRINITY_DN26714_c0_g1_i1.p1  ORF type:complete len:206 (+),score=24.79 TRINITY_DN26714_c0_g1_i1:157-774(+)